MVIIDVQPAKKMSENPNTVLPKNQKNDEEKNVNMPPPYSQVDCGSVIQKQPGVHKPISVSTPGEGAY